MRTFVAALAALTLTAGGLWAEEAKEVKGTVKKVDADKLVVVVVVDGKDKEFAVVKDTKYTQAAPAKKAKKNPTDAELTGGLNSVKEESHVVLTVEKKDGKDVVMKLKVESAPTAKKKKKDK